MKLYLLKRSDEVGYLKRSDEVGYDEYDSFVVAAETEDIARHLCDEEAADEGAVWDSRLSVEAIVIAEETNQPEGIVLSSFNAG